MSSDISLKNYLGISTFISAGYKTLLFNILYISPYILTPINLYGIGSYKQISLLSINLTVAVY